MQPKAGSFLGEMSTRRTNSIGVFGIVSNPNTLHPVILAPPTEVITMPAAKKPSKAKPAAKKKAAPKKSVAKKVAPKKAAPKKAPAPAPAPAPARKHRTLSLFSNAGHMLINFSTDATFEAAMAVVDSTPSSSGGSRTPPRLRTIEGTNGSFSFRTIRSFSVKEH